MFEGKTVDIVDTDEDEDEVLWQGIFIQFHNSYRRAGVQEISYATALILVGNKVEEHCLADVRFPKYIQHIEDGGN